MNKIAVIDTDIDPTGLHCQSFESYSIYDEKPSPSNFLSHGTCCARVLDNCTYDYVLISIQILPTHTESGRKSFGSIEHLRKAFMLCMDLRPDIVCLSAVSSLLSDSKYIYGLTKELSETTTIISALDNKQYITVPSCYPFVIGVQSDRFNHLHPGCVGYCGNDLLGAPYYANCNFPFLKDYKCTASNSLATPVVAAYFSNCLLQKIPPQNAITLMPPYTSLQQNVTPHNRLSNIQYDPPIILVHGSKGADSFYASRNAMDELYSHYKVQASGLCTAMPEYDIRFRQLDSVCDITSSLEFMKLHYKTDIIFLAVEAGKFQQLDYDVLITLDGCRINAHCGKFCTVDDVKSMASIIYHVLQ